MADCYASTPSAERAYATSCGKFYTYIHFTSDIADAGGRVFYVGKGRRNRAWVSRRNNSHWTRTSKKHGFVVVICAYWDSEDDALSHERLLISCFRDMGYQLANVTDGGDGISGFKHSPSTIEKMRASATGRKWTEDQRTYFSALMKGRPGPKISAAGRARVAESNRLRLTGSRQSPEIIRKKSASMRLKFLDPAYREARLSQLSMMWRDAEIQERRRLALVAAFQRPEIKERRSLVAVARWSNPEFKEKTSSNMRKAQSKPDVKLRVLASKKRGLDNHASRSVVCEETSQVFPITRDAVRWLKSLGFEKATESGICTVCRGRQKKSYGYSWRYA